MSIYHALESSPLLTVFLVVAAGTALGAVRFGPLRFGAAGALFTGLVLGALDPALGKGLALLQTLGLALFVYTVGLAAGSTFVRDLRRQYPLMLVGIGTLIAATAAAGLAGIALGVDGPMIAGAFTGAQTSTPALAAASEAAGSSEPAVAYSLAYPIGVIVSILAVAAVAGRAWPARHDQGGNSAEGLDAASVLVSKETSLCEVPGYADQRVRLSYLERNDEVRVVRPDEVLRQGDRVLVVGQRADMEVAANYLGAGLDQHLAHDRTYVDFRRIVVSNRAVVGHTISELDMPGRFGGVITRVRRGDVDLLGRDDLTLEYGDRVLAVVPRPRLRAVRAFLGDSERKISEVDALTMGIGMALGLAAGLIKIPLPGGGTFGLGAAAGPLVVGMVLGALERTGPAVWGMPRAANLTVRQLGLLFFLATVGLSSGDDFAAAAWSATGLKVGVIAIAVTAVTAAAFLGGGRLLGLSAARTCGAFAGVVGQPAILDFANSRVTDDRIESGYAALFALGIIVKLVLVQVLVGL
ncbi:aspartate:alanine exchanger family transporter [Rarobacter incanus]|uniref:aspartate:alanine exchanger family transporter n=2 Tax=Rarobacter incanus TaxID=153494 RepID=UPI001FEA6C63|nr:TrkA C-terminal domain-containing protein [Rarobacter incanus]